jgi:3-oxoacyl-[acyl-carrier protein] reductase
MNLEDMKMVVTGGASGMGRDFCLSLVRAGASVAACDMNEDGLASLAEEASSAPGTLKTYLANVADEASVVELFDRASADLGGVNGLINNAGIIRDGTLVRVDRETGKVSKTMSLRSWQSVIDVNLTGPFLCAREFCSRVIDNGLAPAVVINISSISRHGNMGQSNYSAAKAGLMSMTTVWAKEMTRHGIRFGAIAPAPVDTPILRNMKPEALEMMLKKMVPMRRPASTDEIFAAVKFIVECDYFTGRCIDVDGGMRI